MQTNAVSDKIQNQNLNQKDQNFALFYALSISMQLGFFIIAPLAGFLLLGRWLGHHFGYMSFFIILFTIIGVSVTAYEVYNILKPLLEKNKEKNKEKENA